MAKKYYWEISENETDIETGEETGNIITHKIELTCSNLTGKILISIDGTKFDISEKPFSLKRLSRCSDSEKCRLCFVSTTRVIPLSP